jgi:hypothetical protein
MKIVKKLFLFVFICISLFGYAQQSFQLNDSNGDPYSDGQIISATITEENLRYGEYVTEILILNLTPDLLEMKTLRTNLALTDEMSAYVCSFGNCWSENLFELNGDIEGEGMDVYSLHLMPDTCYCHFGLNRFKLEFWSKQDRADLITLFVEINMQPLNVKGNTNANILLSAYPNPAPANSMVNVSYTLPGKNCNSFLVIKNIMGAEAMRLPLNPNDTTVMMDVSPLKSGVYFYAIETRNQITVAKKLIIK